MTLRTRLWKTAACVVTLAMPSLVWSAEEPKEKPTATPTEAVVEALQKVNQLISTEQWDAALIAANDVLKTAKPGSYDQSLTQLHIAQIHLSRNSKAKGDYAAAIPALQHVMKSGFWEKEKILEWKYILAQLTAQEDRVEEAERYVQEWLAETTAPTQDAYVFYATLLVQRAQADPAKVDKKLAEQALTEIRKGMLLGAKVNDTLYYLQAACYQSLERWNEAAEILEILLKMNPRNKTYWTQLFAMYVTGGQDLRAALTIERAQTYDAMNSPRENMALAQLYHNLQQYDRSIEILEKGLADGTIEPKKEHWEMLGHAYQSLNQEFKAINTFIRADKFVENGYFLSLAGYAYYALQKNEEALKYLDLAVKKGVDNLGQISLFGAYLAFELKQYEKANELLTVAKDNLADDRQRNDYRGLRDVVSQALEQQRELQEAEASEAAPQ
jgi:tetratricopeptide (TPR) repeat protein